MTTGFVSRACSWGLTVPKTKGMASGVGVCAADTDSLQIDIL